MSSLIERSVISDSVEGGSRNKWLPKEIEVPHLESEQLINQIDASIDTIVGLQDDLTGLSAAATAERRDDKHHMGHWWMRDQAILVLALSNGVMKVDGLSTQKHEAAHGFVKRSIDGMVELISTDPWQEGFGMEVQVNPYTGIRELADSKKAPPIHARTNGELDPENAGEESWVAQNQPDAWGFLFQAIAQSVRNGVVELDDRQRAQLESAVRYIVRIQPEQLRQTSMWETTEPGLPPTSSVAVVGKGLFDVLPLLQDPLLRKQAERRVNQCREFVKRYFPADYTAEFNHPDPIDMATLVAMGHDAMDGTSYSRYFLEARRKDLMRDEMPGMIRHIDDPYHLNADEKNGEAAWFLALPYRASIFFKIGEKAQRQGQESTARLLYAKGAQDLSRALDTVDGHGYPPELFEFRNGEYIVPRDGSSSHIGWNDAALIMASTRALALKEALSV